MKVQHRKAAQAYCYLLLKCILLLAIFTERSSERNNSSGLYCTQNAFTDKQCCCEPGWEQMHTFTLAGMIHINSSKDWLFKQLQFRVSSCIGEWRYHPERVTLQVFVTKRSWVISESEKKKKISNVFSSGCVLTVHSSESLAELLELILLDSCFASTMQEISFHVTANWQLLACTVL